MKQISILMFRNGFPHFHGCLRNDFYTHILSMDIFKIPAFPTSNPFYPYTISRYFRMAFLRERKDNVCFLTFFLLPMHPFHYSLSSQSLLLILSNLKLLNSHAHYSFHFSLSFQIASLSNQQVFKHSTHSRVFLYFSTFDNSHF